MFIMFAPYILTFVKRSGYLDMYLQVSVYMEEQKQHIKIQSSIYTLVWMKGKFNSNLKIRPQANEN